MYRKACNSILNSLHRPIADFAFLSENPKLMQRRIASGSIPPPSSKSNFLKCHNHYLQMQTLSWKMKGTLNQQSWTSIPWIQCFINHNVGWPILYLEKKEYKAQGGNMSKWQKEDMLSDKPLTIILHAQIERLF